MVWTSVFGCATLGARQRNPCERDPGFRSGRQRFGRLEGVDECTVGQGTEGVPPRRRRVEEEQPGRRRRRGRRPPRESFREKGPTRELNAAPGPNKCSHSKVLVFGLWHVGGCPYFCYSKAWL